MKKDMIGDSLDRVDGRLKVAGGAKYSGEYKLPGLTYGVLVPATITSGTVTAMDIKAAQRAPGVLAVITPFNAPRVPGYQPHAARPVRGLKLFNDNQVHFNGQPIALVVAETFERATYAATLIRTSYEKQPFETDFHKNFDKGVVPNEGKYKDYVRGDADVPDIEAIFIDKPDPIINPVGSKGLGEISLIGVAAAVANAVYNASGKRIRELPITPDKILMA
jgi:xanthine dehydrogenase YagR molybdenum-binding subunit